MNLFAILPFAAAAASLLLAVAGAVRKTPTAATWYFCAGMALLGLDALFAGLSLHAADWASLVRWLTLAAIVKSLAPAAWLGFSVTYSRGDAAAAIARWRVPLVALSIAPVAVAAGFHDELVELLPAGPDGEVVLRIGSAAKAMNALLLVAFAMALMNLETTFRAAVGTMRWRIKYVVLGLAAIFGAHLYVRSQSILFSAYHLELLVVESLGLLVGCGFLTLAYLRTGLAEADVYPSRAVLRSSFTVLIVGGYLLIVGVLGEAARRLGGAESFQFQALVVLLGMSGLAVLLLSDRLRQRVQAFVGRHFRKAQYDSVAVWTEVSRRLADARDHGALSAASARLIAETFDALSVWVWLDDPAHGRLVPGATTARRAAEAGESPVASAPAAADAIRARSAPFDLDVADEAWAREFRASHPVAFPDTGGHRWCVPLRAGNQSLGLIVLADRVNGAPYSIEELALLQCVAGQMASGLVTLGLAEEVGRARELDAFRTMSAFFVHDLKNAAASLNLMLKNLPVHFDDPAYRQDAIRAVGNTAARIDEMIARLSALRQRPEFHFADTDLAQLVAEAVGLLGSAPGVEVTTALGPLPPVRADADYLRNVIANLLFNARDALATGGRIEVRAERAGEQVVVSVSDNGCGMSEDFLRDSLFRPFQTTKKKGLGIGMFQARQVIDAHGGGIQVDSQVGRGTTVRVTLPASTRP